MNTLPLVRPVAPDDAAHLIPIEREDLLDPGTTFPRGDLAWHVLSFLWRDCCCPKCFSRAPAAVVELSGGRQPGVAPLRVLAWLLLNEGIYMEAEGPASKRIQPYFGGPGQSPELWPRYEFQIFARPLQIEMGFYLEPGVFRGVRIFLELGFDDWVRVVRQERWTKP